MDRASVRRLPGPVIGRRMLAVGLAALICLLTSGQAAARPRGPKERCCFQVSVQVSGTEDVNFGNGTTPPYTSYMGEYLAIWRYAFRELMKLERAPDGSYDLRKIGRYPFYVNDHPQVALHDWTTEWSFSDTPSSVKKACCFTMHPHGWEPACAQGSTTLDSNGLSETGETPRVSLSSANVVVVVGIHRPSGAGFVCGLNDGRLDPVIEPMWEAGLRPPSLHRLLTGTDFAQNCSESASKKGDGRVIVGSTGSVHVRARFVYFPPADIYRTARALDALTGRDVSGFNAPPSTPNKGPRCVRG